jgi:hypothetical protein
MTCIKSRSARKLTAKAPAPVKSRDVVYAVVV